MEAVIEALKTLYFGQSAEQKQQAGQWLEHFQRTPDAWLTCDAILNSPNFQSVVEAQIFAAQTLRSKVLNTISLY